MNETAQKIRELRSRRGFSQEELAERSGLNPRTIQRIENGETEPRGDSLTRLATALDVTVGDLADWDPVEENRSIMAMNLSAVAFLLNPVLGIVAPLIIWLFKKDSVKGTNYAAMRLLNFQITWLIVFYVVTIIMDLVIKHSMGQYQAAIPVQMSMDDHMALQNAVRSATNTKPVLLSLLKGFNALMILVNTVRASRGEKVVYQPAIKFLGK